MTDEEADLALRDILRQSGCDVCPSCGRSIDRGDVAWNNGSTEAGTPCTLAEIICQGCDKEIARWFSWGSADDFNDFVEFVLPEFWYDGLDAQSR